MRIDIRLPVGLLFVLLGIILTAYGAASNPARYQQSLGIDINLYWGIVLLGFGLMMLMLGRRSARAQKAEGSSVLAEAGKAPPHSSHPSGH